MKNNENVVLVDNNKIIIDFVIFLCKNVRCYKTIKSGSSKISNPLTVEQ